MSSYPRLRLLHPVLERLWTYITGLVAFDLLHSGFDARMDNRTWRYISSRTTVGRKVYGLPLSMDEF